MLKHWTLALLALIIIAFLASLGAWQLSRGREKAALLDHYNQRMAETPLTATELQSKSDHRFYRVKLTGTFDNSRTILLDNKTFRGQVGYEVYTPFKAHQLSAPILVDRGFIALGQSRQTLPRIKPIHGEHTIIGLLNTPPSYVSWASPMRETSNVQWPLRVQYLHLTELSPLLGYALFPSVTILSPDTPGAYPLEWKINGLPPEKHYGYATQWFALALTLLVISVVLLRYAKK